MTQSIALIYLCYRTERLLESRARNSNSNARTSLAGPNVDVDARESHRNVTINFTMTAVPWLSQNEKLRGPRVIAGACFLLLLLLFPLRRRGNVWPLFEHAGVNRSRFHGDALLEFSMTGQHLTVTLTYRARARSRWPHALMGARHVYLPYIFSRGDRNRWPTMIDDFRTYALAIEIGDEVEIERDATSRHRDGRVSRGRTNNLRSLAKFDVMSCARK